MQKEPNDGKLTIATCDKLRVALVHDFLNQYGGAERVLKVLSEMYPDAPIFTLLYEKDKMRGMFDEKRIRTSYLQKFPKFLRKRYRFLLPFFMVVPESFDLRDYDLIISSSGAWTKGIVTKLDTKHVSYIHSPMRFVWDYNERYIKEAKKKTSFFVRLILNYVRIWDRLAADRPDYLIANSKYTQDRIEKYYRRESKVIYPPVSVKSEIPSNESEINSQQKNDDRYFLVVSRLSPYKKVDIVVEAFNKLELPLVVIGEGSQKEYLRKIAGPAIKIMGWRDDKTIEKYYAGARGFVFPAEDDFGMAPVEAMSHGVPVIAYRAGGVCETVIEGVTGEFFDAQSSDVLADGVRRFMQNESKYNKELIMKRAGEFSVDRFKKEIGEYIEDIIQIYK